MVSRSELLFREAMSKFVLSPASKSLCGNKSMMSQTYLIEQTRDSSVCSLKQTYHVPEFGISLYEKHMSCIRLSMHFFVKQAIIIDKTLLETSIL